MTLLPHKKHGTQQLYLKAQAAQREGNLKEATKLCEKVLEIDSRHAMALNMLGVITAMQGDLDAALPLLAQAAESAPDEPECHINIAKIFLSRKENRLAEQALVRAVTLLLQKYKVRKDEAVITQAEKLVKKALHINPDSTAALSLLSQVYAEQNKGVEVVQVLRKLVAKDPESVAAIESMARTCDVMGAYEEAIKHYQSLLTHIPERENEITYKIASLHAKNCALEKALEHIKVFLEKCPQDVEGHRFRIWILDSMNLHEECEAAVEEAQRLFPDHPRFLLPRARLARHKGEMEQAEKLLLRHLENFADDSLAWHDLAKLHHHNGRYDKAFEVYTQMKRHLATRPLLDAVDKESLPRVIEQSKRWFTREHAPEILSWRNPFVTPERKVSFLVGFPRSGTTLLQQMLATHPDVFARDENTIIGGMLTKTPYFQRYDGQYIRAILEITPQDTRALRAWYFAQLDKHYGDACKGKRYLDKVPYNLVMLPLIAKLFPETKVICLLRDPRDCCLSSFMQRFNFSDASMNFATLESTINFYAAMMALWPHYREILPLPMRTQRYEDLVAEPEAQLREISDFLGLTWNAAMLEYHKDENRAISTPNAEGIKTPVHTKALGKWKPYEKYLAPHMPQLLPPMREFGYEA